MQSSETARAAGRPPKYDEERRPITVTLPERVLTKLQSVNADRSRAIVKCVEAVTGEGERLLKPLELVEVAPGKALIVVGPSQALKRIEWLRLVEIAPARSLLILPSGTPIEVLEVAIHDLLESLAEDDDEKELLTRLRDVISFQRRGRTISKAELLFVEIPGKG